nr:MAG TPA: hypothetical protein [Caudoviricetes sp.]
MKVLCTLSREWCPDQTEQPRSAPASAKHGRPTGSRAGT